jgi:uncharacterized membrane protein YccC
MTATLPDARTASVGWLDWLRRELAPSRERGIRTLILVCGAVLCVTISMALQVPELSVSAYMIFFISKETKTVTTIVGVLGLVGITLGIVASLLLYKLTYGHPELRVPGMAIVLFLGMYLSRVLTLGPLALILGFVLAATQSIGDLLPSPEQVVRAILWLWVALVYAIALTVVLNGLFLPQPSGPPKHLPKPKGFFVPDAFTNPSHIRFALKVTLAAMFCYFLCCGFDWFGIHTSFITCIFIALESTGATLQKGVLRGVGCVVGGLLALFSIVFLIPRMETIASLAVLVACVSAIAGWVATGTERISYAGLQIAMAYYYGLFPGFNGFAPSTDLTNARDRVVGILVGLMVMALVFHYIWPERAMDRLCDNLRQILRQLAKLLAIPRPEIPIKEAKPKAEALIAEISRGLQQARRQAEPASFEMTETPTGQIISLGQLEGTFSQGEPLLAAATPLAKQSAWQEWQQLRPKAQEVENQVRSVIAKYEHFRN